MARTHFSGPVVTGAEDGIIATPGGGQANARQLTKQFNRIATVATAADSVKLPPSEAGLAIFITNPTATSLQVFGYGTDTINDVATATGVAQATLKSAWYVCTGSGRWYRDLSA